MIGTWQPLLDPAGQARAMATVRSIADALADPDRGPIDDPTLATGQAGLAVFFSYLHEATGGEGEAAAALGYLELAIESVAEAPLGPPLFGGVTGVMWAVRHLDGRLLDDAAQTAALCSPVDSALEQLLNRTGWDEDYDLVSGLVGVGVYLLERGDDPLARAGLERVVHHLAALAVRDGDRITWRTPPGLLPARQRALTPQGYHNLGVAHGVPGVIALLGAACRRGISSARPLLRGAVGWLLSRRLPEDAGAAFASWDGPEAKPAPARLAWCYGDAGIAAALLSAARAADQPRWEATALEIARAAARRTRASAGVVDGGLCHGAAGVAHIFNSLYQATRDKSLAHAARTWFEIALDMHRPDAAMGGYSSRVDERDVPDPGLLSGAAGVALALLSASHPLPPAWDRMLLISSAG